MMELGLYAAAQVPERGIKLVGTLAILGVYVGIIPVMVGLLWSPFIRRAGFERYAFFLSLTVGMHYSLLELILYLQHQRLQQKISRIALME